MKVCSVCLKCYDDSIALCAVDENHDSLIQARQSSCLIVDGYRIDSRIGSNFPVESYKATHLASENSVLIRFLEPGDSISELENDLQAVVSLKHPNLAQVLDFGKTGGNEFYIVSEFIPGQNVRVGRPLPLAEGDAIKVARQIGEALESLHEAGVVHGAVNPSNIIFTDSDIGDVSVKLQNVDFGGIMRRVVEEGAGANDAVNEALLYLSPEQLTGKEIDFRSDFYSLAAVLYKLLLGRNTVKRQVPDAIVNYVFDESDVWGLNVDLRALLAHTLRQSFQRRLELRPPTTVNLVSQLRHLEFIAARTTGGTSHALPVGEPVNRRPLTKPQPHILENIAKELSAEVVIPEIKKVPQKNGNSVQPPHPDSGRESIQADSIEELKEEKQVFSKDIHLLKMEFEETSEPKEIIDVVVEREEPETGVELDAEIPLPSEIAASVAIPGKRPSRSFVYLAGLLGTVVLGGAITAGILGWQDGIATMENIPEVKAPAAEKREASIEEPKELADTIGPESDASKDVDLADTEELDKRYAAASSARNLRRVTTSKNSIAPAVKKPNPKRREKSAVKVATKVQKKPVEQPNAETRSGIFKDVIIYY